MKKQFSLVLCLVLILVFGTLVNASAEQAVHSLLTLGDTQIFAHGEVKNASGEGWEYDAASGTLTLNGAVITNSKKNELGVSSLYCIGDLNIVLKGENVIDISAESAEHTSAGISVQGRLNISGSGKLQVKTSNASGDSAAIYALNGLEISGSTIAAQGGESSRSFGVASRVQVVLKNGAVVETVGGSGKAVSAGVFAGQGSVMVLDSKLTAAGGMVTVEEDYVPADASEGSHGIFARTQLSIERSSVVVSGCMHSAADDISIVDSAVENQ